MKDDLIWKKNSGEILQVRKIICGENVNVSVYESERREADDILQKYMIGKWWGNTIGQGIWGK